METIKEKLYKVKIYFIVLYQKITRVIHYLPVIWKMHDFDHESCLELYKRSLERLEPVLRNGNTANGPKNAKRVRTMIYLINRITNSWDAYEEYRYNKLCEKHGEIMLPFTYEIVGDKTFITTKREESSERLKAMRKDMQEEQYLAKQDLKMLTDMINKWHRHLWD